MGIELGCNTVPDTNYDSLVSQSFASRFPGDRLVEIRPQLRPLINRVSGFEKPSELVQIRVERFLNPLESDQTRLEVIRNVIHSLVHFSENAPFELSPTESASLKNSLLQNLNSLGLITPSASNNMPQFGGTAAPRNDLALDTELYDAITSVFETELGIDGRSKRELLKYRKLHEELGLGGESPYNPKVKAIGELDSLANELRDKPGIYETEKQKLMNDIAKKAREIESGLPKLFAAVNVALVKNLDSLYAEWTAANAKNSQKIINTVLNKLNNAVPRAAYVFQNNSRNFWLNAQKYESAMKVAVRGNFSRNGNPFDYALNDETIDYASYKKLQEHFMFFDNLVHESFFKEVNEVIPGKFKKRFELKED